ncbi:MAG TPA: hypothetical protein VF200_04460 [Woeseiaceae bacterium]
MDQLMTKGLQIYTAALFLGAIAVFVVTVPQLSVLAGMAVLLAIAGIMAPAFRADLRAVEETNAPRE